MCCQVVHLLLLWSYPAMWKLWFWCSRMDFLKWNNVFICTFVSNYPVNEWSRVLEVWLELPAIDNTVNLSWFESSSYFFLWFQSWTGQKIDLWVCFWVFCNKLNCHTCFCSSLSRSRRFNWATTRNRWMDRWITWQVTPENPQGLETLVIPTWTAAEEAVKAPVCFIKPRVSHV